MLYISELRKVGRVNPFQIFERQIAEEKSMIKELKEAFDIVADKLVAAEQRERDLKALLARAAEALQDWVGTPGISKDNFGRAHRDLIAELRKAAG